jgi:hypothetical protein
MLLTSTGPEPETSERCAQLPAADSLAGHVLPVVVRLRELPPAQQTALLSGYRLDIA